MYAWIDEGYTTTIVGDVVSDPLQNAKIEITWSDESIVQQVSGVPVFNPTTEAGLYYKSWEPIYSWDELLDNGNIEIDESK